MDILNRLSLLTPLDGIAVCTIIIAWIGIGLLIENPGKRRPSVTLMMAEYRRDWMREFITREPRIFDAQMLASLRQGTSFFASTCILGIGGVLALLGNTERLSSVAQDLTSDTTPTLIWQIKLLLVTLFLTHGFLKFVWANRLFGYCAVIMGSVPNDPKDPQAAMRASKAGEINIRAAWNFNRGLRSIYFSLGALAWLLGPEALVVSAIVTFIILWRREFASLSWKILVDS